MKAFDFYEPDKGSIVSFKRSLDPSRSTHCCDLQNMGSPTSIASNFSATSDAEYLTSTLQGLLAPEALTKTELRRPEDQKEPRPRNGPSAARLSSPFSPSLSTNTGAIIVKQSKISYFSICLSVFH